MTKEAEASSRKAISQTPIGEPKLILAASAVIAVLVLWIANLLYGLSLEASERGLFGDTFGAVNALFSGLAFAGVTYAIMMQRYEVALAKDEARVTRKILDDQTSHIDRQNKRELAKSAGDTFFKLLSAFQDIAETVYFVQARNGAGVDVFKGRHALAEIAKNIYPLHYMSGERRMELYDEKIDAFVTAYSSNIGHYLRSFEALLVYLTTADGLDREFYAEIILGQLSESEQQIIFHVALRPDFIRFKALIERYHLLSGLGDNRIYFDELRSRYSTSAFYFSSSYIDDFLNIGRKRPPVEAM